MHVYKVILLIQITKECSFLFPSSLFSPEICYYITLCLIQLNIGLQHPNLAFLKVWDIKNNIFELLMCYLQFCELYVCLLI